MTVDTKTDSIHYYIMDTMYLRTNYVAMERFIRKIIKNAALWREKLVSATIYESSYVLQFVFMFYFQQIDNKAQIGYCLGTCAI